MSKTTGKRRRIAQKRLTAARLALDADPQTVERMIAAAKESKPKEPKPKQSSQ